MAEREKRRATTFRTSKGTIVNVAAPSVYVSPAFISSEDVTSPYELMYTLKKEYEKPRFTQLVSLAGDIDTHFQYPTTIYTDKISDPPGFMPIPYADMISIPGRSVPATAPWTTWDCYAHIKSRVDRHGANLWTAENRRFGMLSSYMKWGTDPVVGADESVGFGQPYYRDCACFRVSIAGLQFITKRFGVNGQEQETTSLVWDVIYKNLHEFTVSWFPHVVIAFIDFVEVARHYQVVPDIDLDGVWMNNDAIVSVETDLQIHYFTWFIYASGEPYESPFIPLRLWDAEPVAVAGANTDPISTAWYTRKCFYIRSDQNGTAILQVDALGTGDWQNLLTETVNAGVMRPIMTTYAVARMRINFTPTVAATVTVDSVREQ